MLMIPGPAECTPETLQASAQPLLPHYGPEYLELHHRVCDGLRELFGTAADVCLLPGPGTAGTEFSLCGFAGQEVVVVEAGAFGERLSEILRLHGARVHAVRVQARRAVGPGEVEQALAAAPNAVAVAMVHSETSTGILHPVEEIAAVVGDRMLLVDAVSSIGATPFAMDAWRVDIAWTASQKALAAPPGMAMVAVSARAWDHFEANRDAIRGFLLNPVIWKKHIDEWAWHPYPTSLPTPVVRGLDHVLRGLLAEGEGRNDRHRRAADAIVAGAEALGFERWARAVNSPTVSALIPPLHIDEEALRNHMAESGVMIAGGFGGLRGTVIRIGHMGPGTSENAVRRTIEALAAACLAQPEPAR
jgi:alanine-glyoxylate transaminase/serine-glyoxylate transaminase/serine-pyruvate transaminase